MSGEQSSIIGGASTGANSSAGQSTSQGTTSTGGESSSQGQGATNQESATTKTSNSILGDAFNNGQSNENSQGQQGQTNQNGQSQGNETNQENKGESKSQTAPEAYESFKIPEGFSVPQEYSNKFVESMKGLNLNQENAQKVVDLMTEAVQISQAKVTEDFNQQVGEWREESNKYLGEGEQRAAKMANVQRAVNRFADHETINFLNATGLGEHPILVRFYEKVGAAFSEDSFREGKTMSQPKTDGQLFYPNM